MNLFEGDCLDILPKIESASVDAVITDSPYPEVKRDYGCMTETAWMEMMQEIVRQSKRILKSTGSAVFILQPNSRKVGSMRTWLWEFLVWCGKEWNIVQDVYWWNHTTAPTVHSQRKHGLLRPSGKMCVWLGNPDCYRNQDAVLWSESEGNAAVNRENRMLRHLPSGQTMRKGRCAAVADERGGVTPFNVLPIANADSKSSAGVHGHGAGTPLKLADWWTRYICPPGGIVLDMFAGSGTMGLAAIQNQCNFIGIEKMPKYYKVMCERLSQQGLFA